MSERPWNIWEASFLCTGKCVKAATYYGIGDQMKILRLYVLYEIKTPLEESGFECTMMQVNAHSQTIKLCECNQLSSVQLESIHGLATVFRVWRHPLPLHSQNPATGNRSLHTLPAGLPCQLNRRKRPDDLGSQWAPDVDGDIVMSRESYAQWPCITLWKSPNSYHMWSVTRGSVYPTVGLTASQERSEMKNVPQEPTYSCKNNQCCQSCISPVIYYLCRHKHSNPTL